MGAVNTASVIFAFQSFGLAFGDRIQDAGIVITDIMTEFAIHSYAIDHDLGYIPRAKTFLGKVPNERFPLLG